MIAYCPPGPPQCSWTEYTVTACSTDSNCTVSADTTVSPELRVELGRQYDEAEQRDPDDHKEEQRLRYEKHLIHQLYAGLVIATRSAIVPAVRFRWHVVVMSPISVGCRRYPSGFG